MTDARPGDDVDAMQFVGRGLEMAGISLWHLDLATRQVHYAREGFHLFAFDRSPVGVPLDEVRRLIHPEDRVLIELAAEDARHTDRLIDAVARYRGPDGQYRHLLTRRCRVRDAAGQVVALRGMSIDVSELVRERQRSLALLERIQMVAETVGVGFWWRDIDAGVFEWDEQMYRLHHRRPEEAPPSLEEWIGRHVHPADRGWLSARQEVQLARWDPASDVMFRTVTPEGGERWIQAWTRRLVRDGHQVALGMHVDITERRRAEQRAVLERQRDQFAIESAGIGVWERRLPDGEPTYWSPTMYRLHGLAADDPRPLQALVDASRAAEDAAASLALLRRCARTGEHYHTEFEVTWPDGTRRWLAASGRPVLDAAGQPVAMAGVDVDITERRQMEQLARERDRAWQASAAKSELMARVSHELRTPMNAVLGFADLMAHDAQAGLAPAQAERLGRIRAAGSHLLGLIDDLLELSRADQGGRMLALQPVALAEVLHDTLPWVASLAAEGGITLVHTPGGEGAVVLADRRRLGQVLTNLLTNAIKYNQPGGHVWFGVEPAVLAGAPAWALAVRDDGRGMAPAQLQRLFEPFNRLGAERDGIPGTGIGLSIVQRLVADMGGELGVDSAPRQGSCFVVRLAAASAAPTDGPAVPQAARLVPPPSPPPARPLRVLYVEDNPVNEMLVREMLSLRPGVQLTTAPDGGSGIASAAAGPVPDLVLLDLQLPDMSGVEVMRRLRGQPRLAACRFVALSANAMREDVAQALAAGFNEYWTKPLDLRQFLADIDVLAQRLGCA